MIQDKINKASPFEKAIMNRAFASKAYWLRNGPYYKHALWDKAVMNKF